MQKECQTWLKEPSPNFQRTFLHISYEACYLEVSGKKKSVPEVLQRSRKEDQEFEASLPYVVIACLGWMDGWMGGWMPESP